MSLAVPVGFREPAFAIWDFAAASVTRYLPLLAPEAVQGQLPPAIRGQ